MIHQHFMLIPQMTVVENIIAGDPSNRAYINFDSAAIEVEKLANDFGLK